MVSFDVFDTVITRQCGGPESIFLLTGHELTRRRIALIEPHLFALARRFAEARLYARANSGPGTTIREIYCELEELGVIKGGCLNEAIGVEFKIELENCVAIPGIFGVLESWRRDDGIIFISDMYLDDSMVKSILTNCGVFRPNDRLFVSSKEGFWKRDGKLFLHVISTLGIGINDLRHFGNDVMSDVFGAKRVGVSAKLIGNGNFIPRERFFNESASVSAGLGSSLAGACRLVRLGADANVAACSSLIKVAASVAAPPLIVFVLWVLNRAEHEGVKRLFFLSRDGQILIRIARELTARLGYDIELHYIYASRQSWFLASLRDFDVQGFDWILRVNRELTVREVLLSIGLNPTEIESLPTGIGLGAVAAKCGAWTPAGMALLGNLEVKSYLQMISERRREVLARYFSQVGLTKEGMCALVDLGWSGSIQKMGQAITENFELPAYYLGLRSGGSPTNSRAFFGPSFQPRLEEHIQLVESFCFADHPSVVGFCQVDEIVVPEFATIEATSALLDWGLRQFQQGIVEVASIVQLKREMVEGVGLLQNAVIGHLSAVNNCPTKLEADILGSQPWEDGVGSVFEFGERGAPYRFIPFLGKLLGFRNPRQRRAEWVGARVSRSGFSVRALWSIAKLAKRLNMRIKNV